MNDLPVFDEVHVISDIHMGGQPGFQILRETKRLANFIRRLTGQRPGGRLALVLNGDVFDTLAEDVIGYVAIDDAQATIKRIMEDESFKPVWDALAAFVKAPRRALVIVIGNHDIEVAFPPCSASSAPGWQATTSAGLPHLSTRQRARDTRMVCGPGLRIHGNEVDAWNYNRYEDLAKVSRRMNAGMSLSHDEWKPNAGTRMVKEVMNNVKRRYAWVDLLKPETSAAVGTLLVLDASQASRIGALFGIVGERKRGDGEVGARLSAEGFVDREPSATSAMTLEQMIGPNLKQGFGGGVDDMLYAAESNFAKSRTPRAPVTGTLGTPQLIVDRLSGWLTGVSKAESLRRALRDWLENDKTFAIDDLDDTFRQVSASVGPTIDFIVTGHTHLERAIDMGQHRFYFNSGTWIRLLRFTPAILASEESFAGAFQVLMDGRMSAIDSAVFDGQPFVLDQNSAVSICEQDGRAVGSLVHVEGDGTNAPRVIQSFSRP
jgi:UDP-2,3-diacylglucosamine pyrophosphatase LpxH